MKICTPPRRLVEQVLRDPLKPKELPLIEELLKTEDGRLQLEEFADRCYREGFEDG